MTEASPLLRLPAELRNRIWSTLLVPAPSDVFHLEPNSIEHPILSVNRQLRSECSGIFYANTTFQFNDPEVCIRRLTTLSPQHLNLIEELRYDTSETCTKATSWRSAFREMPGLDEDTKLEKLREELEKRGVRLKVGVLKARILIGCRSCWTCDPLAAALEGAKQGRIIGRMMFV